MFEAIKDEIRHISKAQFVIKKKMTKPNRKKFKYNS